MVVVETTTNNTVPVVIPRGNDESEEDEAVEPEPEPTQQAQTTTQAPEEPKGMLAKAKVNSSTIIKGFTILFTF